LIFLPTAARENALYPADLTELWIAFLFPYNHIPARSVFRRKIHHRRYRWRGQTEKAYAAYKKAIAIAKMDDPSAQSASLPGRRRTPLHQVWGSSASSAQHTHGVCESSVRCATDVQRRPSLCSIGKTRKSDTPLAAKLSRKAIREKKFGTIPKMRNSNPSPSL
jgi:hypothetical protein